MSTDRLAVPPGDVDRRFLLASTSGELSRNTRSLLAAASRESDERGSDGVAERAPTCPVQLLAWWRPMAADDDASTFDVVDLGVFARAWAVQTRRISWFLGAGTSAAAGVPTASRIVDDLLVRMYADAHGLVREALEPSHPAAVARTRHFVHDPTWIPAAAPPRHPAHP